AAATRGTGSVGICRRAGVGAVVRIFPVAAAALPASPRRKRRERRRESKRNRARRALDARSTHRQRGVSAGAQDPAAARTRLPGLTWDGCAGYGGARARKR